ncbi:hypothetical protein ACL7TT_05145 [Microbulbifer sp. 2304DJ12-6]|uniref:hypothetical protein n=1 Tax=Microbulbifer sp. 2304DJ12-6 TaxID=3233340 RepID=UPI0039AF9B61
MRSLLLLISLALFPIPSLAHDRSLATDELRQLKREVIKLRKEFHSANGSNAGGEEVRKLKKEVIRLRKELHTLQNLIVSLQTAPEQQPVTVVQPAPTEERPNWTCYMQDIKIGDMYSQGYSRKAKGKLLETCTTRGGTCSEYKDSCSTK